MKNRLTPQQRYDQKINDLWEGFTQQFKEETAGDKRNLQPQKEEFERRYAKLIKNAEKAKKEGEKYYKNQVKEVNRKRAERGAAALTKPEAKELVKKAKTALKAPPPPQPKPIPPPTATAQAVGMGTGVLVEMEPYWTGLTAARNDLAKAREIYGDRNVLLKWKNRGGAQTAPPGGRKGERSAYKQIFKIQELLKYSKEMHNYAQVTTKGEENKDGTFTLIIEFWPQEDEEETEM